MTCCQFSAFYIDLTSGEPDHNLLVRMRVVPNSVIPLSETLISLMRDRGSIKPAHWEDGSIFAGSFYDMENFWQPRITFGGFTIK